MGHIAPINESDVDYGSPYRNPFAAGLLMLGGGAVWLVVGLVLGRLFFGSIALMVYGAFEVLRALSRR